MGWSAAETLECRVRGREAVHETTRVGIDLGKTVFHLVGLDSTGKGVIRKRCPLVQLFKL
jgi:hypothetical protein